jgi:hypothetical protein
MAHSCSLSIPIGGREWEGGSKYPGWWLTVTYFSPLLTVALYLLGGILWLVSDYQPFSTLFTIVLCPTWGGGGGGGTRCPSYHLSLIPLSFYPFFQYCSPFTSASVCRYRIWPRKCLTRQEVRLDSRPLYKTDVSCSSCRYSLSVLCLLSLHLCIPVLRIRTTFYADPYLDPAFHFDADPDPIFHSDPDPAFQNTADPDTQHCHFCLYLLFFIQSLPSL